jgi:hypothetical protein
VSLYEIGGFYSGEKSDCRVLGCDILFSCRWVPIFWRYLLPPFSGLKMEAAGSAEMLVTTYKTTVS